jgi:hypothetical protein
MFRVVGDLGFPLFLCNSGIAFLCSLDFLEAVKLFSVKLVEFGIDVFDCVLGSGYNNVLAVGNN